MSPVMKLNSIKLNILTLNVWGIPLISSNRKQRISDIARELNTGKYDIVSLQEVWSKRDRRFLQNATTYRLPYSHYFHSGVLGAGLLVLSKYPIVDTIFHAWLVNGYPHRVQHADWFGGKGVGFCRIRLNKNAYLHLYNTHLHAEYDSKYFYYKAHRIIQAFDTAQFIAATRDGAALQILAGDLNSDPDDFAYKILLYTADLMDTCNVYGIATYRNPANAYTSRSAINTQKPNGERIDHILYRVGNGFNASILEYKLALQQNESELFHLLLPRHHPQYQQGQRELRSLSDHEPLFVRVRLTPHNRNHSSSRYFEVNYPNIRSLHNSNGQCNYEISDKLEVTKDAMDLCVKHLKQLKMDQMFYTINAFILFALIFAQFQIPIFNGCEMLVYFLKLLLFIVGIYFIYMATIWNLMERNGIQSVKTAMQLKLNSWSNFPNSVFSMSDEPTGN